MRVLVTGGTGKLGKAVVNALRGQGVDVRVLTRNGELQSSFGLEYVVGDLQDPQTVRPALEGVDKLFLLVANVADELTQSLLMLQLAREAGVQHLTYLSVFKADHFPQVPHFIAKNTVETALKASGVPFTILRAGYFFQNDAGLKAPLTGPGLFPTPIGNIGIAAVDVRDIADVGALSLMEEGHAGKSYNLVGSAPLNGTEAAHTWSKVLGKPVTYPDLSPAAFEQQVRQFLPTWHAMELRMMFECYGRGEFLPAPEDVETLTTLLGRPLRSYETFAKETAADWQRS